LTALPLLKGRPNPFNPATTSSFDLARPEHLRLVISDVRRARVRTLVDENRPAGPHAVRWDGRDDAGASVASGIYFMRMQAGSYTEARKLVLLK
jgi:flagellar hook assembly protein FlgD